MFARFLAFILCLQAGMALSVPLDTYTTYVTAHPAEARKGPFAQLMARGTGTNDMYVMEVDPTTGALPISGSFAFAPNVSDFGVTTNALRTASVIGNTTGQAAFGTGTRSAQTLRVTVATDDSVPVTNAGITSIDGKTPALGQTTMSGSVPVAIASNQSAVPASQSGTWTVQPGNTANTTPWLTTISQGGNSATVTASSALKVDGSAVTQPVSAASLPLPTGAATESTLSTLNGKVANDYGVSTGAVRTAAQLGNASGVADFGSGAAGTQTLRVVPSTRSETASTPLAARLSNGTSFLDTDTGAASSTTLRTVLSTRQESVATPLAAQLSNGTSAIDYGSGAAGTATLRVVPSTRSESASTPLAVRISDGSSFGVPAATGRSYADSARNAYASTNVTTGAWVQLIASTAAVINQLYLFDSSGQTLELGTGAAASETRKLIIPPGGIDGPVNIAIPAGTRISVRAVSGTASTGELTLTGFQ